MELRRYSNSIFTAILQGFPNIMEQCPGMLICMTTLKTPFSRITTLAAVLW